MLSYTKISTFNECGRKFKYKYLDKYEIPMSAEKQNTFDRGTFIHNLIAKYLDYAQSLDCLVLDVMKDTYEDAKARAILAYTMLPPKTVGEGFNRKPGKDCYPELTEEIAINILTTIQEEVLNGWKIYGIEMKDFARFNNFYSIFDCVLYYETKSTITFKVVDWKTGNKPHAPISDASDQLSFYAAQLVNKIAPEHRDKKVEIQAQYVTILNKTFRVVCGAPLVIPQSFMMLALSDINDLQRLDVDTDELRAECKKNLSNPYCRWCEYAQICKTDND